MKAERIPLKRIKLSDEQMRTDPLSVGVEDLARSIERVGLLHPLVVRRGGDGYVVVAGVRRYLALVSLNWEEVPCVVIEGKDQELDAITVHENIHRQNVNPVEEARWLERMHKKYHISVTDLARMIGKSHAYVSQRLKLLSCDPYIVECVEQGKMSFSVGRELDRIDDPGERRMYARMAAENGCSEIQARLWVSDYLSRKYKQQVPGNNGAGDSGRTYQSTPQTPATQVVSGDHERSSLPLEDKRVWCYNCGEDLTDTQKVLITLCVDCGHEFSEQLRRLDEDARQTVEKDGEVGGKEAGR